MRILMLAPHPTIRSPIVKLAPVLVSALRGLGCDVTLEPWGRRRERETIDQKIVQPASCSRSAAGARSSSSAGERSGGAVRRAADGGERHPGTDRHPPAGAHTGAVPLAHRRRRAVGAGGAAARGAG